jgi:hypothetical protein
MNHMIIGYFLAPAQLSLPPVLFDWGLLMVKPTRKRAVAQVGS